MKTPVTRKLYERFADSFFDDLNGRYRAPHFLQRPCGYILRPEKYLDERGLIDVDFFRCGSRATGIISHRKSASDFRYAHYDFYCTGVWEWPCIPETTNNLSALRLDSSNSLPLKTATNSKWESGDPGRTRAGDTIVSPCLTAFVEYRRHTVPVP